MSRTSTGLGIAGLVLGVGGAVAAVVLGRRRADKVTADIEKAVAGETKPAPGQQYPTVQLRLTHYYPFTAHSGERKMEGGVNDRAGYPLHTVEDFVAGKSDHVSLSGDPDVWPYGQMLLVPWGDKTLRGRVTDTGSHFTDDPKYHGAGKVVRAFGYEPIDVCVYARDNSPPKTLVTAQIVPGDNLAKKGLTAVATGNLKGKSSLVGADLIGLDVLVAQRRS